MKIIISKEMGKFIYSLEKQTIAKVLRTLDLLEEFGYKLPMPHSKKVSRNIFELRTRGQQEIRIFYCFYQSRIYLISGFVKKSQRIPRKELENAENKYKTLVINTLDKI